MSDTVGQEPMLKTRESSDSDGSDKRNSAPFADSQDAVVKTGADSDSDESEKGKSAPLADTVSQDPVLKTEECDERKEQDGSDKNALLSDGASQEPMLKTECSDSDGSEKRRRRKRVSAQLSDASQEPTMLKTEECSSSGSEKDDDEPLVVGVLGGTGKFNTTGFSNTMVLQRRKSTTVEFKLRSGRSHSISIEPIAELRRDAGLSRMLDAAHMSAIRLRNTTTSVPVKQSESILLHSSDSMKGLHQSMNKITTSPVDDDDECPICLDLIINNEGLTTSCKHNYHYVCLLRFLRYKNVYNCPYCTQEVASVVVTAGNDVLTKEQLETWFYSEASDVRFGDKCFFTKNGGAKWIVATPTVVDGKETMVAKMPELTFQLVDSKSRDSTFTESFEVRLTVTTHAPDVILEGCEAIVNQNGLFTLPSFTVTTSDPTTFDFTCPVKLLFTVSCLVGRDDLGLACDEKFLSANLYLRKPAPFKAPTPQRPPQTKQPPAKKKGLFTCCT